MEDLDVNSDQDEKLKDFAQKVFNAALKSKMIHREKEVKFYHVDGIKMASLALSFECDNGSGEFKECTGCKACMEDRQVFGKEYNRLTAQYKERVVNQFLGSVRKASVF